VAAFSSLFPSSFLSFFFSLLFSILPPTLPYIEPGCIIRCGRGGWGHAHHIKHLFSLFPSSPSFSFFFLSFRFSFQPRSSTRPQSPASGRALAGLLRLRNRNVFLPSLPSLPLFFFFPFFSFPISRRWDPRSSGPHLG